MQLAATLQAAEQAAAQLAAYLIMAVCMPPDTVKFNINCGKLVLSGVNANRAVQLRQA